MKPDTDTDKHDLNHVKYRLLKWWISALAAVVMAAMAAIFIIGKNEEVPASLTATPDPVRAATKDQKQPGEVFKDCYGCPDMVVIPAGRFEMGSPKNEVASSGNEEPVHTVNISSDFALSKTEVTHAQFAEFVKETSYDTGDKCYTFEQDNWLERIGRNWQNPGYPQKDNHPATCLNWNDAKSYTEWLSRKTGKQYRLPSEAEWEYAARGKTGAANFWGSNPDQVCRYGNVADKTVQTQIEGTSSWKVQNCTDGYAYTAPVGSFDANTFGINDMLGNVWEWVDDVWHDNYKGAPLDGSVWKGNNNVRVLRGGSWSYGAGYARTAIRLRVASTVRINSYGFRLARTLQ